MAQTVTAETKHKFGSKSFPILFDNGLVRVYKNPMGEIYVEDIRSGVMMQITSDPHIDGGLRFATEGRVEPIPISNPIIWRVSPR